MKRLFGTLLLLLIVATGYSQAPKYIFYFIGDGMGPESIQQQGPVRRNVGRPALYRQCCTENIHQD